ncbi:MAG: response regulator [Candidatus Margulisbacteria bacterium]|nr:response regulator [Candidatus Margulisiibacteriota bacterium]
MSNKPLILTVDDETEIADFIAQTIKDTGRYEALTANSGKEALEVLAKNKVMLGLGGNKVKLVILDIKMPDMDGLTLLGKIRKGFGEDIGAMMLTAWEDSDKWNKATDGFVVSYLKKPIKAGELIETIDKYFSGKATEMVLETFEKHIDKMGETKK